MNFFNQKELGNPKQLGTYDIKDNCYMTITHEMIKKIVDNKLSKENDLHTYAIIKNICDNTEDHKFYGTGNYIASRLFCNIPAALRSLNKLTKAGLITKLDKNINTGAFIYTLPEYINTTKTDSILDNYGISI